MPTAEELAKDPDFIKLHEADPKAAEQIMTEQLQVDNASPKAGNSEQGMLGKVGSFVGNAFKRGGQEFLEATPTAAKIASFVVPGAIAGRVAAKGGGQLAQLLGAGAGNELVTMGSRLLQPGSASVEQRLTPGIEDAASLAAPFVGQAVTHPVETAKGVLGAFAKSSRVGKQAAQDLDMAQAKAEYTKEKSSYDALKEAQTTAKKEAAEKARLLAGLQREENVPAIAEWVKNRPGVPTETDVNTAYGAVDTIAKAHGKDIFLPELAKAKKLILTEADHAARTPGVGEDLAKELRAVANQGALKGTKGAKLYDASGNLIETGSPTGPMTLSEMQYSLKALNNEAVRLSKATDSYSKERLGALNTVIRSIEDGLERMESDPSMSIAFKSALKAANAVYLKQKTHEELGNFLTRDMVTPNQAGTPTFSPHTALKQLDSKGNAKMVGYMQKVFPPDANGKSLYDVTKATLTEMASTQNAEREAARMLKQTGGMTLPNKPTPPIEPEPPRPGGLAVAGKAAGVLAGGLAGYQIGGSVGAMVGGGSGLALGFTPILSQLMMTKGGQNLLVSLVKHQGREISPAMVGMWGAALQSMQGEKSE